MTRLLIALAVGVVASGGDSAADPAASDASATSVAPPVVPELAAGWAWSLEAAAGASASAFSVAPALGEQAAFGMFLASSPRTAWSLELFEASNLTIDHTTPELGLLGVGGRHLAKPADPWIGQPDATIDFQRIAAGVAFAYDGRGVATGVGIETSLAYLVVGAHGVSVNLAGYFFDASNLSRDAVYMLSVGYVFSRVEDRPLRRAPPGRDESHACMYVDAYRSALAEIREQMPQTCQDEHAPACERLRARTQVLNVALNKCVLGEDVGPPPVPDAP